VDHIGDVVDSDSETFEPPPETMSRDMRSVIVGVHKLDRQLMHVLNSDRVCEASTVAESKAHAAAAGR